VPDLDPALFGAPGEQPETVRAELARLLKERLPC